MDGGGEVGRWTAPKGAELGGKCYSRCAEPSTGKSRCRKDLGQVCAPRRMGREGGDRSEKFIKDSGR